MEENSFHVKTEQIIDVIFVSENLGTKELHPSEADADH